MESNLYINPRTYKKIKENSLTYKKLEKEYNIILKDENIVSTEELNINKEYNKDDIEHKIKDFLEKQNLNLKDNKKPKIYDYRILKNEECSCHREIEIKINENETIKKDIKSILEIIKKEYNENKKFKDFYGLEYECEFKQIDEHGNIYGFTFEPLKLTLDEGVLTHCYNKKNKNYIDVCIHVQYLSNLNLYNKKPYHYKTYIYIRYL